MSEFKLEHNVVSEEEKIDYGGLLWLTWECKCGNEVGEAVDGNTMFVEEDAETFRVWSKCRDCGKTYAVKV